MFEISIREVPLVGIKSKEQLAAFILASLGLSPEKASVADVKLLLAMLEHKEGLKVKEISKKKTYKEEVK